MGIIRKIAGAASAAASRGDVPSDFNDGGAIRTGKSASKSSPSKPEGEAKSKQS